MSEWGSLLLVFWALWVIDGWRLPPVERFGIVAGRRRARIYFERLLPPAWWPTGWTAMAADIPFSFSPTGVSNRPAGAAGRPTDAPAVAAAWRWEEIKRVEVKAGWLEINGRRFVRDTGHLSARQLLTLAALPAEVREARLAGWLRRWLRPAHLRRRAKVLRGRTAAVAAGNGWFLGVAGAVTVYLLANGAERLPEAWAERVGGAMPGVALALFVIHAVGIVGAWRAMKRLPVVSAAKRGSAMFTAALLPPQALRLRALCADGYFPAQHPLAWALAFASPAHLRAMAFDTLADLRWPVRDENDAPLAREISGWFRVALQRELTPLLRTAGVEAAELFAAPAADGPASRRYCPRCRCQFTTQRERCPHGVKLESVVKGGSST